MIILFASSVISSLLIVNAGAQSLSNKEINVDYIYSNYIESSIPNKTSQNDEFFSKIENIITENDNIDIYALSLNSDKYTGDFLSSIPSSYMLANHHSFCLALSAAVIIVGLVGVLLIYQVKLSKKNKSLILSQANLQIANELLEKEIQLRESKNIMEKVIQTAPLVYVFTVNGIAINTNLYAQDYLDIYPGDKIETLYGDLNERQHVLDMLEANGFVSGEIVKWKTKDFKVNRFHLNVSKVDYEGSTANIIWSFNIEAGEYQKDSLANARNDLQKVLNALPIPLVILNSLSLELLYANKSLMKLFRIEQTDDIKKIDMFRFLPEKQPDGKNSVQLIKNIIKEAEEASVPTVNDVQHILDNGDIIYIRIICETLSYKGKCSVIILMQDVSAEKMQAKMLENTADKEKEANQLKSRFIINMSHEIRTPMNAIIGFSEIELTKPHSKNTTDVFRKINSSAKNLLTIINDILDFSKMEAEKLDIIEDVFDLEEVISNAMVVSSQRLDDKFVEMHIDVDCDLPVTLVGDKTRLWQVLKNLLDNAAKYTLKGIITLTVTAINKNAIDNIFIKFQIKDTGMGMKEASIEKLFAPFEQFHQHEVNVHGTGLGMAITKQLTELMGGTISVESKYGTGTTVTVIIPFKQTNPVCSIRNNCAKDELKKKSILVVDDNPLIIDMLTSFLSSIGVIAVSASTAEDAYEKAALYENNNKPFDIILLDYILEEGTCLELAKKIKANLNRKSKLILLSAYSKRLLPEVIREHGFVEVIEKPFVPSTFLQKICQALNINVRHNTSNKRINFSGAKVLLCEDNKINQEVAQGMLSMCNIVPIIAENGKEAIKILQSQEFHLILMDILMPVMDGHETTVQIRNSDAPYSKIPIVAMTANAMKDEVDKCKAEGMNGHVSKPIDFDKLYAQLLKWVPKEYREEVEETEKLSQPSETLLEGIDMAEGIARFGGNRKRYTSALYRYASTFNAIEQPFEIVVSDENISDLKKQIHTIKGVSGNLGITVIYNAALAFEKSLSREAPNKLLYMDLQNICAKMNKAIVETFPPNDPEKAALPVGTPTEQNELIGNLKIALQSFDPESCDKCLIELKSKKWQHIDEALIKRLCIETENYRFESALGFLDRIQGSTRQLDN